MNATPKLKPFRPAMLAFSLAVIATTLHAQDYLTAPNDYVKRQKFTGASFFKDNNIWIYNQAFAEKFGMPTEWVNPELQGVEAAAFRVEESSNVKTCGMAGKEDQCIPGGNCMLDLYVDEAKYPLPWREPEQKADWVNRYSSMFWLKEYENPGSITKDAPGIGTLSPFVDKDAKRILMYYVKTDRELKDRGTKLGWARYTLFEAGYRRAAVNKLTLLVFRTHCENHSKYSPPSAHYLYLGAKDGGEPIAPIFHQAVLPLEFTERMNELMSKQAAQASQFYKSILFPNANSIQPQGDKK